MEYELLDRDASPMAFIPQVDWSSFDEPNIIHSF
jgi:hypothetical protein